MTSTKVSVAKHLIIRDTAPGEPNSPPLSTGAAAQVFTVSANEAGERLDRYLASKLDALSRARVQALIRDGEVRVGGRPVTGANFRLKAGEAVTATVPPPNPATAAAEPIPLDIAYEDAHLLVIDKPAGLVVHPAPGHGSGTLVNALLAHCGRSLSGIGGQLRPGIVHRLDKDTSGLLVVAKTEMAHRGLAGQFAAHGADGRLARAYLALCWGVPARPRGVIDARIGRSPANRKKMAVVAAPGGRHALTRYTLLESFAGAERDGKLVSLLRVELETGRTHQIRVHMTHVGHPVVGDPLYGQGFKTRANLLPAAARGALQHLGRQALHAAELAFEHPATLAPMSFASPPPPDFARLLNALKRA